MISALLALQLAGPFSVASLRNDLSYLTSDVCGGRLALTAGSDAASNYLANELKKAGIKPGGAQGYFDAFTITQGMRATTDSAVALDGKALKAGKDFTGLVASSGTVNAGMVFVGFGRDKDYEGHSIRGSWAVLLRGPAPGETDETLAVRAGRAQAAGAIGVVFAGPKWPDGADLVLPTRMNFGADIKVPVLSLSSRFLKGDFWKQKADYRAVWKPLQGTLSVNLKMEANTGNGRNVVGIIPGTDPALKNQIIVMGAHYDHLGMGQFSSMSGNDLMHRGADDNGSGTTGLLALARQIAKDRTNKRTVMIQFYSGEEIGLVGSTAWVRQNAETMKRVYAMLNMDMIGRLRNGKLVVFGVNTATEFGTLLKPISVDGVKPELLEQSPGNSDHAAFAASVPVLFFNTDLHSEYHTERDTIDTINFEGMSQVVNYIHRTFRVVDATTALTHKAPANTSTGGDPNRRRRVRTGFIPDMSGAGPGLLLNGASPGSPAAKAGVQAGDRLIKFGNVKINGIEDLQTALAEAEVGKPSTIIVVRGGKEVTLTITPEASAAG